MMGIIESPHPPFLGKNTVKISLRFYCTHCMLLKCSCVSVSAEIFGFWKVSHTD